jgi:hypothetical protein
MNVPGISGSLRTASVSTALLKTAATRMPGHVKLTIYDGLGNLPHFNPEIDTEFPPPPVSDCLVLRRPAIRNYVRACSTFRAGSFQLGLTKWHV